MGRKNSNLKNEFSQLGQQKQKWKKPKIYAPHLDVSIEMEEFSGYVTMLKHFLIEYDRVESLGQTI